METSGDARSPASPHPPALSISLFRKKRGPRWLAMAGWPRQTGALPLRLACTGVFLCLLVVALSAKIEQLRNPQGLENQWSESSSVSRHIRVRRASNDTSDSHSVLASCDYEEANYPWAWGTFYTFCVLLTFVGLAIVCDDFFVPSLEAISEKLQLSEDVAGATFMAAGSSAPELFSSVAAAIQGTDVGVGTIVGSAAFNILVIVALSAALAGQVLNLDWRPLTRDSVYYALSIVLLIAFSWDGKIWYWEALILLVTYVLYIVIMKFNVKLMKALDHPRCRRAYCCNRVEPEAQDAEKQEETNIPNGNTAPRLSVNGDALHEESEKDKHIFHHHRKSERRPSVIHERRDSGFEPSPNSSQSSIKKQPVSSNTTSEDQKGNKYLRPPTRSGANSASTTSDFSEAEGGNGKKNENTNAKEKPAEENGKPAENGKGGEGKAAEEEDESYPICCCCCTPAADRCCPRIKSGPPNKQAVRDQEGNSCWKWFKFGTRWLLYVLAFPFLVIYTLTIPDCSTEEKRKWFWASFLISVLWIAAISFAMVLCVEKLGCLLHIDSFTMALVVVAIGTSVPDAISSVIVARDGYGDMAVSNALGSNVFDINLGIGLPMFIRSLVIMDGVNLLDTEEQALVDAGTIPFTPHVKFSLVLLFILATFIIILSINKFRLNKVIGLILVLIYVAFLAYAFIQDKVCDKKC